MAAGTMGVLLTDVSLVSEQVLSISKIGYSENSY